MKYKKLYIFYFSGTGNAYNLSMRIKEIATFEGLEVFDYDISKFSNQILSFDKDCLLGFCSPTHGFHFPEIMRKFIRNFPGGNSSVFIMNTRAGTRIWRFTFPGLSGVLHYVSSFHFIRKGYKIVGLYPVDLPSNWLSIHPALSKAGIDLIYSKQLLRIEKFANNILAGKRDFRALYDFVQDFLISPISVLYIFIGRFFLAKSFLASSACNNCGLCLKNCPVSAIKKLDGRMFWTKKCESCMKCMSECPKRAIETAHGFIIGFSWIVISTLLSFIDIFLLSSFSLGEIKILQNSFVRFIINSFLALPILFLGYRTLHYLMRFRVIERLVILTSLTHYKFWGRYKAPKDFST